MRARCDWGPVSLPIVRYWLRSGEKISSPAFFSAKPTTGPCNTVHTLSGTGQIKKRSQNRSDLRFCFYTITPALAAAVTTMSDEKLASLNDGGPMNIATIWSGFEKADFMVLEERGNRAYFDFFEEVSN